MPDIPSKVLDQVVDNVEKNIIISASSVLLGAILLLVSLIMPIPKILLVITTFIILYGIVSQGLGHDFFERNIKVFRHTTITVTEKGDDDNG